MGDLDMYPAELKYTKDHEWIRLTNNDADVGITDFAQKQLGDVVYVELPDVGRVVSKGEVFGTIESVKAVSELFSPASGEITAVNTDLSSSPEQVNSNPHGAWIIKIKVTNPGEAADLLTADQYAELVK
jgi:glycine cleavage system H protein